MIDLSECRHVDAAAIGLLLNVQRRLSRGGGVLIVRAMSPRSWRGRGSPLAITYRPGGDARELPRPHPEQGRERSTW
ncbi:STAS domain-containing protein [Micromonospora sp. A3M-1-15]|uniref:STAS domain-containing protein n=1 Tax=Micromonospora sp. A3M-1-15 TaxID=2962035 RepID=UPI0035B1283B